MRRSGAISCRGVGAEAERPVVAQGPAFVLCARIVSEKAVPLRRALVSVSDKSKLETLARVFVEFGIEVLSTGNTAKTLQELGVEVIKVSDYTGAQEILRGRVKTLHPKIHAGLLATPSEADQATLQSLGYGNIDLLVVNLYPFQATVARPGVGREEAIENIDIGGPTMIRGAAKNCERVSVIVDPEDYEALAQTLREQQGTVPACTRRVWAQKAFAHTAAYDVAIANYLADQIAANPASGSAQIAGQTPAANAPQNSPAALPSSPLPDPLLLAGQLHQELRYGENPHQQASLYRIQAPGWQPAGLPEAQQLQGKPMSYNNLLDADAALALIRDLTPLGPAAAVFKHLSPCGACVGQKGDALADLYIAAREADRESSFGGIVAVNQVIDASTAERLAETFLEVVLAPGFDDAARAILSKKSNLRLLILPEAATPMDAMPPWRVRTVAGGVVVQREDKIHVSAKQARVVTRQAPQDKQMPWLDLGISVVKHLRSNAVVLVRDGVTVGIGGGQSSRVEAVRQAIARAGEKAIGAVVASDAFFPFADSVELFARAGVSAIVQPGGSIRDEEVIEAADKAGLAMIFSGERHFRH